jgi:hypothetical protein
MYVGFVVLTAVVMKISIFQATTPCTPLNFNWYFEQTYHLHLQSWRVSQGETNVKHAFLASCFTLVISQKTSLHAYEVITALIFQLVVFWVVTTCRCIQTLVLKMEAAYSSKTWVCTYKTTLCRPNTIVWIVLLCLSFTVIIFELSFYVVSSCSVIYNSCI